MSSEAIDVTNKILHMCAYAIENKTFLTLINKLQFSCAGFKLKVIFCKQ